jgi:hypothetical protein
MDGEVACKLRPLRPAGKPERDPGRTELAATDQDTALPQAPNEPTGRRQRPKTDRYGQPQARPRYEVHHMATISKLRNKIENVSALKGWRMRWYMQ